MNGAGPTAVGHEEVYFALPDDGIRRELIGGELLPIPSPRARHQRMVVRLVVALDLHLRAHGGGQVFVARFDVVLSDHDVAQPDVLVVADADAHVLTEANIQGPPSLVVEVASDPVRDRRRKRDLYGRSGVREYWIVDPDMDRVEVYRPGNEGFSKPVILEPGDLLTTELLPGLSIDLAELLAEG